MVIYFSEDLRARSRTDWLGRVFWQYETARTNNKVRHWLKGERLSQRDFEASFSGPPPKAGDRDFRAVPQEVGLCVG